MGYTRYFAVSLDAMSMATFLASKINLLADFFALFVGKIAKEAAGRPRLPLYPVQFRLAAGFLTISAHCSVHYPTPCPYSQTLRRY